MNINQIFNSAKNIASQLKPTKYNANYYDVQFEREQFLKMKPEPFPVYNYPSLNVSTNLNSQSISDLILSFEQEKLNKTRQLTERDPRYGVQINPQVIAKIDQSIIQFETDASLYFTQERKKGDVIIKIIKDFNDLKALYNIHYASITGDKFYKATNFNIKISRLSSKLQQIENAIKYFRDNVSEETDEYITPTDNLKVIDDMKTELNYMLKDMNLTGDSVQLNSAFNEDVADAKHQKLIREEEARRPNPPDDDNDDDNNDDDDDDDTQPAPNFDDAFVRDDIEDEGTEEQKGQDEGQADEQKGQADEFTTPKKQDTFQKLETPDYIQYYRERKIPKSAKNALKIEHDDYFEMISYFNDNNNMNLTEFATLYASKVTQVLNKWFEYKYVKENNKYVKTSSKLFKIDYNDVEAIINTTPIVKQYYEYFLDNNPPARLIDKNLLINLIADPTYYGFTSQNEMLDFFGYSAPAPEPAPAPAPAPAPMPVQITYDGITPLASKMLKFEFDKYIKFINKWKKATIKNKDAIKSDYVKVVCDVYNEWFKFKYASKADQIQQSTTKNNSVKIDTITLLINSGGNSVANIFANDIISKKYPRRLFPQKALPDKSYAGLAFKNAPEIKAFFGLTLQNL